jgi:hypothetical protein
MIHKLPACSNLCTITLTSPRPRIWYFYLLLDHFSLLGNTDKQSISFIFIQRKCREILLSLYGFEPYKLNFLCVHSTHIYSLCSRNNSFICYNNYMAITQCRSYILVCQLLPSITELLITFQYTVYTFLIITKWQQTLHLRNVMCEVWMNVSS